MSPHEMGTKYWTEHPPAEYRSPNIFIAWWNVWWNGDMVKQCHSGAWNIITEVCKDVTSIQVNMLPHTSQQDCFLAWLWTRKCEILAEHTLPEHTKPDLLVTQHMNVHECGQQNSDKWDLLLVIRKSHTRGKAFDSEIASESGHRVSNRLSYPCALICPPYIGDSWLLLSHPFWYL